MSCHRSFALRPCSATDPALFVLRSGLNRVGSSRSNEVRLTAVGVSKLHAQIEVRPGSVLVEDLASKNGTFVNGERVTCRAVAEGDTLGFGRLALRMEPLGPRDDELAIELASTRSGARVGESSAGGETPYLAAGVDRTLDELVLSGGAPLSFPPNLVRAESPAMREVYRRIAAVAASDLPVLVLGETGTGKEGIARLVHLSSPRSEAPLVALNCAAIPAELLEAELFGVERGAATGVSARLGTVRKAEGGTLFLDEVGEMPAALQAKLLRVLQEGEVQPVGGAPTAVDVRIVAATNGDLDRRVARGGFRSDLYYRLAGMIALVPPLRQRPEDIPALVAHFARNQARKSRNDSGPSGLTVGALESLTRRRWPGNVRQLAHAVAQLVVLCSPGQPITSAVVETALCADTELGATAEAGPEAVPRCLGDAASDRPMAESTDSPALALPTPDLPTLDLATLERQAIDQALAKTSGNQSRAAPLLGITRDTLRRRMKRFGLLGGS